MKNKWIKKWKKYFFPKENVKLRYYATFKVTKFEPLFYKINTCLQKNYHLHWIAGRATLLCQYLIYIFSILGVAFSVLSLCYFQKLQLFVVKKFWNSFCCIVLLFVWAQKECLRFLQSYLKLEPLIFLSFLVSFLVDMFDLKAPFQKLELCKVTLQNYSDNAHGDVPLTVENVWYF